MVDASLVEALKTTAFFAGTPDDQLEKIASIAGTVEFGADQQIFREGQATEHIYVVLNGNIAVEVCAAGVGCRRILTVGPGELLGWSPLLGQLRMTANARTLAPAQAVRINAAQLLAICEHDPRFGYEFMRRVAGAVAQRLKAARLQMLDVYGVESSQK